MAGSGKTTFLQRLNSHMHQHNLPGYLLNLDPAVMNLPYSPNIDIRDTVRPLAAVAAARLPPPACRRRLLAQRMLQCGCSATVSVCWLSQPPCSSLARDFASALADTSPRTPLPRTHARRSTTRT